MYNRRIMPNLMAPMLEHGQPQTQISPQMMGMPQQQKEPDGGLLGGGMGVLGLLNKNGPYSAQPLTGYEDVFKAAGIPTMDAYTGGQLASEAASLGLGAPNVAVAPGMQQAGILPWLSKLFR